MSVLFDTQCRYIGCIGAIQPIGNDYCNRGIAQFLLSWN